MTLIQLGTLWINPDKVLMVTEGVYPTGYQQAGQKYTRIWLGGFEDYQCVDLPLNTVVGLLTQ